MSLPVECRGDSQVRPLAGRGSAAAVIARRGLARRQQSLREAHRESEPAARAAREQIETERWLAAVQLQSVLDEVWWETAAPAEIASMWEQANRRPTGPALTRRAISETIRRSMGLPGR